MSSRKAQQFGCLVELISSAPGVHEAWDLGHQKPEPSQVFGERLKVLVAFAKCRCSTSCSDHTDGQCAEWALRVHQRW